MTPIFITSWGRLHFTRQAIGEIRKRTAPGTYSIHVLDNGSDDETRAILCTMALRGEIDGLTLLPENTACVHPKHVFGALVPDSCRYFVVSDNDFIPAQGWLPKMLEIMERNPGLAACAPQYWPQWPQEPNIIRDDYVACKAIGNTFKVCRTDAYKMAMRRIPNEFGKYSDDGALSEQLRSLGMEVGFARNVFTYNLELTQDKWGYTEEQLKQDPRKAGYQRPTRYEPVDWETLAPPAEMRIG